MKSMIEAPQQTDYETAIVESTIKESAITNFVEKRLKDECDFYAEYKPELWATRTEELLEDFRIRLRYQAQKQLERILDKEQCYFALQNGAFDPVNKATRQMFFDLTGIKLSPTQGFTRAQVREYVGADIVIDIENAQKKQIADKKKAVDEAQQKIDQENIARISMAITTNEPIDGADLCVIAEHLGIVIPIRTKGAIRQRVTELHNTGGRIKSARSGKFTKFDSYWPIFRQVQKLLGVNNG